MIFQIIQKAGLALLVATLAAAGPCGVDRAHAAELANTAIVAPGSDGKLPDLSRFKHWKKKTKKYDVFPDIPGDESLKKVYFNDSFMISTFEFESGKIYAFNVTGRESSVDQYFMDKKNTGVYEPVNVVNNDLNKKAYNIK